MSFVPTFHPIFRLPTAGEALAMGEKRWLAMLEKREELIRQETKDPLRFGWEPPVWKLVWQLLDVPWVDRAEAKRVRDALGFTSAPRVVGALGGNRSGKSECGAKTEMKVITVEPNVSSWACHQTAEMSVKTHHKLFRKFMPAGIKIQEKSEVQYTAYKQKTGFSDHSFVLPNGSEQVFKHYSMTREDALQSAGIRVFWCDELVPPEWVDDLMMRIASMAGFGLITFTPREGYSPTVRMLLDGSVTALEQTAYLIPKDGGKPDVARALGFGAKGEGGTRSAEGETKGEGGTWSAEGETKGERGTRSAEGEKEEWDEAEREMRRAHKEGRWSVPTEFVVYEEEEKSFTEGNKGNEGRGKLKMRVVEPVCPKGRKFEMQPRVVRCADDNFAVVYFYSNDNPFGRPDQVIELSKNKSTEHKKEVYYGFASKTMSARFPKFKRGVHTFAMKDLPATGTWYHFVDPASGRNFLQHWYLATDEGLYLVKEWPGNYEIPGIGVPGPWALPDGRNWDGRPGPAQKSFGFGTLRLKEEIARIEGWPVFAPEKGLRRAALPGGKAEGEKHHSRNTRREEREQDPRVGWTDVGATWKVFERFMDSRAASSPRVENDRPRTLLTDFEDIGLDFLLTPGDDIIEGVNLINDALDYDEEKPLDFWNKPHFFVCDECTNAIFALETWMGRNPDGTNNMRGATKDPIDLIRYAMLADIRYVAPDFWETEGGGHY